MKKTYISPATLIMAVQMQQYTSDDCDEDYYDDDDYDDDF